MDIQIADENFKKRFVLQDFELEFIIKYAKKWSHISNDTRTNELVLENVKRIQNFISNQKSELVAIC